MSGVGQWFGIEAGKKLGVELFIPTHVGTLAMLKANVGLSRKITRDYNSTGYSVNFDGEIPFSPDDAEGVLEKVRELFDLAQEAMNREIDRDQGEMAIGRRDEELPIPSTNGTNGKNGHINGHYRTVNTTPASDVPARTNGAEANGNGNGKHPGNEEVATNKQVQFILTMGKRFKLSTPQLESRIVQIVGRKCGVYELTKKEAGRVLDQLTNNGQPTHQQA
jgi:hypothetical protein